MVGTWFGFGVIWSDFVYEMWMVVSTESPQEFQQTTKLYNFKKKLQECMGYTCYCVNPNCHSKVQVSSFPNSF